MAAYCCGHGRQPEKHWDTVFRKHKEKAVGKELEVGGESRRYRPKTRAVIGIGLLFLIIFGGIAWTLCNFRVQNATQEILAQQHEAQQTWMDKSLDAIRVWRNELVDQARFISSSEMFRLFVIDVRDLSPKEIEALGNPESLSSPDEATRAMAEQLTYIQDLLRDFTARRAWTDARILLPDGSPMVEPTFSVPLTSLQIKLAQTATEKGAPMFGPIRMGDNGLVMDMADPLFEVLGKDDQKVVAILLLSVPMDRPLATFLARNGDQMETMLPRLVNPGSDGLMMALSIDGHISLRQIADEGMKIEPLPFGPRSSLDGKGEVYSMGGVPTGMDWLFVLETPAAEVEARVDAQKMQIYGLGVLASVGLALLALWLWAGHTSRKHKLEAIRYEKLYRQINEQKMMLDSINASFNAGMILADANDNVRVVNPAFRTIFGFNAPLEKDTKLSQCMDSRTALTLQGDMNRVNHSDKPDSVELTIPTYGIESGAKPVDRLYRVDLYPYSDTSADPDAPKFTGCVAIFKDITEFRRKAEERQKKEKEERERQAALISAFVRAVESVDPNMVGHSDKMAAIADLLAGELAMDEKQRETLRLAAKLSQVGKIYVPRELLTKKGKLTDEELAEMRRAPEYADRILHDMHFDLPVRETVGMMGERMNGTGKPLGLAGSQITPSGRALALVNAFIAMTSSRAWRKDGGMSIAEAINALGTDGGFDHQMVDALSRISPEAIANIIGSSKKTG